MRTLLAVIVILTIGLPVACLATVDLGIFLQSQSPDGRMVEINGGIWSTDANILGWTYNWGDGSANTGYFPMIHRYYWPGPYTVTVTGYDDTGDTAIVETTVNVPEPDPTDVVFVLCEPGCWSIKDTDSLEVRLFAFNGDWVRIPMEGRTVQIFDPGADPFVDVEVRDSTLMVTAKHLEGPDYSWASIFPYVDGVRSLTAVDMMTNKHPGDFRHYHLSYVGSYLPDTFFVACSLSVDEYTHINDFAFNADMASTYGKNPNQGDRSEFQGISYAPPLYSASGNPLGLGDYSIPQNGRPFFDAIFHEMGRNFSGVNQLFTSLAIPGEFYSLAIAEWYVQYDIDQILTNHSEELTATAITMLEDIRNENRMYHLWEYGNYIDGGCVFNYYDNSASLALTEKIYEYCDVYGWDRITIFLDFFAHDRLYDYAQILANHGGITDETNRVTFLLAALSHAVEFDVRPDFVPLNFPINDGLFADLMALWGSGVNPGDRTGPDGRAIGGPAAVLYQNRPNPVRGATEIAYWLAGETKVELAVYDVQGRVVAALDRGVKRAGLNQARFDASNLSPGVYFCRLVAGPIAAERKIVIAR